VYAGEAAFRHERRVFATVSYTQEPPVYNALTEELAKFLAPTGLRVALQETYLLDVPELPSEAATIAAHLARVGATTVVFIGDPIMPIYLTRAAAAIGYYPEWVISGTVFTDTSTLGRYYDQREWSHAFGISALAVPTPIAQSDAYRLYRWYYGTVPPAPRTATVVLPGIEELFNGIELAGPHLTPSRYEQGLFRLPPAGGGTTTPLVAFGDQGAPPLPAYSSPADYTYIWYDASATGTDEEGVAGRGMVRFVDGGRRYASTTVPAQAVPMFVKAGSILQYPVPPPADRPPSYPPWPGSPVTRR
jgi:hypothetical protein